MRVLLLHPDDTPLRRECTASHWDLIVDLGFAGTGVYDEWSRRTGCRILTLHQFGGLDSYRWVKQGLVLGRGRLLDRLGLDWWEILAPCGYQEHQALYLVDQLHREIGAGLVELVATRAHSHVRLLSIVTGWPVRYLIAEPSTAGKLVSKVIAAARNLRPSQMVEIAFDKWDPGFQLRSQVTKHRRVQSKEPVVLLPSAYSNVTRTQLAYAAQLRDRRFLLATTRRSGESKDLPSNVDAVPLSAYAETSVDRTIETAELIEAWNSLQKELGQVDELRRGMQARLWDYFTRDLETGLRLRDAWRVLMSAEPVKAVLCGDDLNYHTRLPLILARSVGARALYCSHGALDGGLLFKKSYADLSLVKGEMERDYMLQVSDVEPERIEIAAPFETRDEIRRTRSGDRDLPPGDIVLFSQPYEVGGGRAGEIYREILGPLVQVARQLNRRIILKLHPFESRRGRARLLRSVLTADEIDRIEINTSPASEVLSRTLLGVGLDSSVAVECAQREIPFFLCGWLDFSGFGYLRQFARFGVGVVLGKPSEILSIPQRLIEFKPDPAKIRLLSQTADPSRLEQIMFGTTDVVSQEKCAR
jgi:hypothetical protein